MKCDNDVRRLHRELAVNDGNLSMSAKKSGMDRKTARKYAKGPLPSERVREKTTRDWVTRQSPILKVHEEELKAIWDQDHNVQPSTLLDYLLEKHSSFDYDKNLLRTIQRRVKKWKLEHEEFRAAQFAQEWHPGKAMQLDWTWMNELEICIEGELFEHRLCHAVFPHSNWSWATICFSESLLSLKEGFQEAVWRAGGLPHVLQTDNSSAATHRLGKKDAEESGEKRDFNHKYKTFLTELGVEPQTIPVGCSNANADIETRNGHLKSFINQRLLLRGSRNFSTRDEYQKFLNECLEAMNKKNAQRCFELEEKPLLMPLPPVKLPTYDVVKVKVSSESLIHIDKNTYSVPNKLIGEELELQIFEDRMEVYQRGNGLLFTISKLHGQGRRKISFEHLIDPLLRKIGAFRNYRYQEYFFPGTQFRRCYDLLCTRKSERQADRTYLEILKVAADHGVVAVDSCLQDILNEKVAPTKEELERRLEPDKTNDFESVTIEVDMASYACFDEAGEGGAK